MTSSRNAKTEPTRVESERQLWSARQTWGILFVLISFFSGLRSASEMNIFSDEFHCLPIQVRAPRSLRHQHRQARRVKSRKIAVTVCVCLHFHFSPVSPTLHPAPCWKQGRLACRTKTLFFSETRLELPAAVNEKFFCPLSPLIGNLRLAFSFPRRSTREPSPPHPIILRNVCNNKTHWDSSRLPSALTRRDCLA